MDNNIPQRPTARNDESIRIEAAKMLVHELRVNNYGDAELETDRCIQDVASVLRNHNQNGYDIARAMEEEYLFDRSEIDAELVSLLDNAPHHIEKAAKKAVAEWVSEYGVKAEYSVGDKVRVKVFKKDHVDGEVVHVDETVAKYTVFVESLGHVREGMGTHGLLIPFEEILPAEEKQENPQQPS